MAKVVAVAAAVGAGQPPQPVVAEGVAVGALGQRRDFAEAVVGVAAAEPLVGALIIADLEAGQHAAVPACAVQG